jgi:hypothetical protein
MAMLFKIIIELSTGFGLNIKLPNQVDVPLLPSAYQTPNQVFFKSGVALQT